MNQIDTKPRIRRKAEVTPPHCIAAPKNAPKCYGDPQARIVNPDCACCAVRDRCAEFIDQACRNITQDHPDEDNSSVRTAQPGNAPLVLESTGLFSRFSVFDQPAPNMAQKRLWSIASGEIGGRNIECASVRAYVGGLITIDAATEIAEHSGSFHRWLVEIRPGEPLLRKPYVSAMVWLTAAVARRALGWQGRPDSFNPRRHYEVWEFIADAELSFNSLRKQRQRVGALYRRFKDELLPRS